MDIEKNKEGVDTKDLDIENQDTQEEVTEKVEEIEELDEVKNIEDNISIKKTEYEELLRQKKARGDYENAFKKEKEKNKQNSKDVLDKKDAEGLKRDILEQVREDNFFNSKGILNEDDRKEVINASKILGVSLEEAFVNDIVKGKLQELSNDRANSNNEDKVSSNSIFTENSMLSDDNFVKAYDDGKVDKTPQNNAKYVRLSGIGL